ncbi:MAG TPA: hypothetical protein VK973_05820 [Arenicellales bacterium]|nr:hypothetical protein [Arenicellales bacterium]
MNTGTRVEFYSASGLVAAVSNAGALPAVGDLINIRKQTWQVTRVTWAVDHSDYPDSQLRANIDLAPPDA